MYDNQPQPERNDPCWCGSGKKYKKCHLSIDNQLQHFYDQGLEVPARAMLKSADDIEAVRKSATVNTALLDYIGERIGPGVSTAQINDWVNEYTESHGGIPADLDFQGYPFSVCTSINEVVCHGMPSEDDILKEGDIVNVDCSTIVDGYFSDSSRMFCIGKVSDERKKLVEVTREAMLKGLEQVKPWGRLGDVGAAVKAHAEANGFSVVREFGGHGIGWDFHEDPFVSHVTEAGTGVVLAPGMMFTIEPMINAGDADIDMTDPNGWTVRTADGSDSAQWEIQVVVTEDGYELLSW